MTNSEVNGLGKVEKGQDRSRAGVQPGMGSLGCWGQLSTTAQRCCGCTGAAAPLVTEPRVPTHAQDKFRVETTMFKYLNTTTYYKCVVVVVLHIISFVHIAAQRDVIDLTFEGKRLKHRHKSKIMQLENVLVRKVT